MSFIEILIITILADIVLGGLIMLYLSLYNNIDVFTPNTLYKTTRLQKNTCIIIYILLLILFLPMYIYLYIFYLIFSLFHKK